MKTRNTKQKEIINNEMNKFKEFFSAEELLIRVNKIDKKIGIATIYRILKDLRKKNEIYSYTCGGKLLYSVNKKSHCHYECEESGEILHFDIDSLDFIKDKIPGTITSFQIEIKGTCKKCNKK